MPGQFGRQSAWLSLSILKHDRVQMIRFAGSYSLDHIFLFQRLLDTGGPYTVGQN